MKSKIVKVAISVAATLAILFVPQTQVNALGDGCGTGFAGGDGTADAPYQITNTKQFDEIADCSTTYAHFKIMNDLDFSAWTNSGIPNFIGVLDGNGKTLSNLNISKTLEFFGDGSNSAQTLFGKVEGTSLEPAKIQNIRFSELEITTRDGFPNYSGLIGLTSGVVAIKDVSVVESKNLAPVNTSISTYVSLLVAKSEAQLTIEDVYVDGELGCNQSGGNQFNWCGGLVAFSNAQMTVEDVHIDVDISCIKENGRCGGLVGQLNLNAGTTTSVSRAYVDLSLAGDDADTNVFMGGAFGQISSDEVLNTVNISDLAVEVSSQSDLTAERFGGVLGYVTTRPDFKLTINLDRVSVLGEIPAANGSNSFVAAWLSPSERSLEVNFREMMLAGSLGKSDKQGLLVGEDRNSPVYGISDIFHDTNQQEGVDFNDPGDDISEIITADRSDPDSYPGLNITENLESTADWFVQAPSVFPKTSPAFGLEVFGGYSFPFAVADAGFVGDKMTFNANFTGGNDITKLGVRRDTYPADFDLVALDAQPQRSGFEIAGWGSDSAGSDPSSVDDVLEITPNTTREVFAIWTELFDVTFNDGGADSGSVASQTDKLNITVPGEGDLVRSGFQFAGWQDQDGNDYSVGDTINLTKDLTLTAQWTELFDVSFNSGGANSGSVAAQTDKLTFTVPGQGDLVREGFTFAGWKDADGTDYTEGQSVNLSKDLVLTAQWTASGPPPAPAPVFRPYTGPEPFFNGIEMLGCAINELTLTGTTLYNLDKVTVGGIEVDFEIISDRVINLDIGCLTPGSHDLTFHSRWGNNTAKGKVVVVEEPVAITPAVNQKVNAGSFKGYVAVYALGHEGKRLSAKIGKDWVVIPEIPARDNNLYRVTDFTGAGVDIQVRIYIDRELLETIPLTTK